MQKMSPSFTAVLGAVAFAGIATATPPAVVLNEYNAVKSSEQLTECDQYWGNINGNGGNWVELLVTATSNMRGWKLEWRENKDNNWNATSDNKSGSITFKDVAFWGSVPAGTIITVREVAEGMCDNYCTGLEDENPTLDTVNGDWWIGVYLSDDNYVTHTQDGSYGFLTSNDNWGCRIKNAGGTVIQDWVGEGAQNWGAAAFGGTGVGKDEVCKLHAITTSSTITNGSYFDGDSGSFGSFNYWSSGLSSQDLSSFRNRGSSETDVWDDNDYCGGDHTVCTPTCP